MQVGDLVRCKTALNRPLGIITRITRPSTTSGYNLQYWVLLNNKRKAYPFLEKQIELIED